ncbi:MAG TPA: protein-L-isoaspartate(D-aspartate) O-methyltransferase [Candidatus Binataceae bacterium]|nr:protein-L-isoaspartate(D-aspartate) O-methyltransferase [Candidatus Binataceae bacterium]
MRIDQSKARTRMVTEQLEQRGIKNKRVLTAMRTVERERFLPGELAEHAYDDGPLPIGSGQTISQPYMVALMSEASALIGNERVLEIGTGSGYQAAILSRLAGQIYSVEIDRGLHQRAGAILRAMGIGNVMLRCGDGSDGWPDHAPFDVVIVTAAMPGITRPLLDQLRPDGRLIAPIGEDELQTLVRIGRKNGVWQEEYFGECVFVPMSGRHGFKDAPPDET